MEEALVAENDREARIAARRERIAARLKAKREAEVRRGDRAKGGGRLERLAGNGRPGKKKKNARAGARSRASERASGRAVVNLLPPDVPRGRLWECCA